MLSKPCISRTSPMYGCVRDRDGDRDVVNEENQAKPNQTKPNCKGD